MTITKYSRIRFPIFPMKNTVYAGLNIATADGYTTTTLSLKVAKNGVFQRKIICGMSACAPDSSVFATAHRKDIFITVVKKDTGKIAVAYHSEIFEYKS